MFGVIGTCRWDVTDDKTLVISPLEGEEGVLVESVWPWQESDIRKVELIGKIVAPEHMTYMFYNCHMLEDAGSLKKLDVSRVYNIRGMFAGCSLLKDISFLENWDTGRVTDISYLFFGCASLKSVSPLGKWDTKNLRRADGVFEGCVSLADISGLRNWDTGNIMTMKFMFYKCMLLEDISPLSGWDTKNLVFASYTFFGCMQLRDISALGSWNTRKVMEMSHMFENCASLKDISPLSGWDTGSATEMHAMFCECISLNDISPLRGWNTENVRLMSHMFYGCGITDAGAVDGWNIKSLYSLAEIFRNTCVKENPFVKKVPMACPETGSFTAWKKCCDGKIVELLIPEDARRSSAFGKKCRCDKAKVLEIQKPNGLPALTAVSCNDRNFVYRLGKTVSAPDFDTDRFSECAAGIHFFMDRKSAEDYSS